MLLNVNTVKKGKCRVSEMSKDVQQVFNIEIGKPKMLRSCEVHGLRMINVLSKSSEHAVKIFEVPEVRLVLRYNF